MSYYHLQVYYYLGGERNTCSTSFINYYLFVFYHFIYSFVCLFIHLLISTSYLRILRSIIRLAFDDMKFSYKNMLIAKKTVLWSRATSFVCVGCASNFTIRSYLIGQFNLRRARRNWWIKKISRTHVKKTILEWSNPESNSRVTRKCLKLFI